MASLKDVSRVIRGSKFYVLIEVQCRSRGEFELVLELDPEDLEGEQPIVRARPGPVPVTAVAMLLSFPVVLAKPAKSGRYSLNILVNGRILASRGVRVA